MSKRSRRLKERELKQDSDMGYQVYRVGKRWGGYGVPSLCEHPECNKEIDRGISFACGGEPFSEHGCDRYFCENHRYSWAWDSEKEKRCEHEDDCDCEYVEVCKRCYEGEEPYPYKPERPNWIKHLLTDDSWAKWRKENKKEVLEMQSNCQ